MIVRAAQVVLFLVGPDLILEIIRRTTGADATAVIGIIVNFRVLSSEAGTMAVPDFPSGVLIAAPFAQ